MKETRFFRGCVIKNCYIWPWTRSFVFSRLRDWIQIVTVAFDPRQNEKLSLEYNFVTFKKCFDYATFLRLLHSLFPLFYDVNFKSNLTLESHLKVELSFNMVPWEIAKAPLSYLHVVPHLYSLRKKQLPMLIKELLEVKDSKNFSLDSPCATHILCNSFAIHK